MQFFRYFPTVSYSFGDPATQFDVVDLTAHVVVIQRLKQNITVLYDYLVQDGERPDTVAEKLYGSVSHTWLVLLLNGIFSLFDWPLTSDEFNAYIVEKYGSVSNAQSQLIYQTSDGYTVDALSYAALPPANQGITVTAFDQEFDANELKRTIKAVPNQFVGPLVTEMKRLL
jgi:hypothetical protein